MRVATNTRYVCRTCKKEYRKKDGVARCCAKHKQELASMPKYKVGSCVLTYDLGDSHYGIVKTTVIKARGKGYDKQLLVENDDGSRWWVNAVSNSSDVDGVFLEIVSH